MAIDFSEEKIESGESKTKKIVIFAIIVIALIVVIFVVLNKNKEEPVTVTPQRMFAPINIDFAFISSGEFRGLEEFDGIPVLPGFYEASDEQIQPEKIEIGRTNPFSNVTEEEIKQAVLKVILKLSDIDSLTDLETTIMNSSLYNEKQKQDLQEKIQERKDQLEQEAEDSPQGEEIILDVIPPEDEIGEEVEVETTPVEEENPQENPQEDTTNKSKTW